MYLKGPHQVSFRSVIFAKLDPEQGVYGLHQVLMTMISKNFLVFEVSISNRLVFRADREYANENCQKRIFWPPEGREGEPPTPKNLQTAITLFRSFSSFSLQQDDLLQRSCMSVCHTFLSF